MIIIVALLGGIFAAFRDYPALLAAIGGMSCLGLIRTFEAIDHASAIVQARCPIKVVQTFIMSMLIGFIILAISIVPGICYLLFMYPSVFDLLIRGKHVPLNLDLNVILIAALMTVPITSFLRRRIW